MIDRPFRVLMLSKACIVGTYQRKLEEIAKLGVELLTLVPPSWKDERGETSFERVYDNGYRLNVLPIALNGNFHLHWYPGLGVRIRDFRPDIVHIDEEPYNVAAWQALYHARRVGARSLFFSWQNLTRQYPPPFSWGERWVLNSVDYVLAGTASAAAVWRTKGYTGRIAVIPQFGVDPALFHPKSKHIPQPVSATMPTQHEEFLSTHSLALSPKSFTIGYVGRLVEEKGVHLLLEAASQLKGDWRLRIVGSGPERDSLGELADRLGIGGRTEWIEWVISTEMPEQYRQLDVLIVPSLTRTNWKEQFGRVLIEAMASGVPIIGSDSGAIPDITGGGGLIVPEGDVIALANALHKLQDDAGLCATFGEAGRKRVLEHFTHEQVAADTVAVYREMLR
jgi:glycosyltransferase involved in cell wall biosynthesis